MFKVITNARTVNIVKPLEVIKRKDSTGKEYDTKQIFIKIASNRPYTINGEDGNKTRQSDFMLAKARGNLAQIIADYCSDTHTANGQEKHTSRFLSLEGHLESYKSKQTKKENIEHNVLVTDAKGKPVLDANGNEQFTANCIEYDFNYEQNEWIFVITDLIDFLDSKPVSEKPVATAKPSNKPVSRPITPVANTAPVINDTPSFDINGNIVINEDDPDAVPF